MTTNKKQTANREITKKKKRKDSKKVGVRVRASHSGLAFSFSTLHLTPHIPTATGHPTGREAPHQPWRGLLSTIVCHEAAALTVQCLPREPRTVAAESTEISGSVLLENSFLVSLALILQPAR
jgi:hypothetical protein